jgi:hypothetical protein
MQQERPPVMPRKVVEKVHFSTRIRPEIKAEIEARSAARGMGQGEYLEHLIATSEADPHDYYLRQSAFQSFVAASLVTVLAGHLVSEEDVIAWRDRAAKHAREIFGDAPRRRFEVPRGEAAYDPRIAALFEAFGAG